MTKKLNTLIDDIYTTISTLSEGKPLNVSEKAIEEFGEDMKEALRHWATPPERNTTEHLRMSNIGKQDRQLWFDINSTSKTTETLPPHLHIKFLYGHLLEVLVLFFVKLAGHKVTSQQKEVSVQGIKGHMDCVIDGEVVDVKTASGYGFKKFKDGTLAEDDTFGYLAQLAGYEYHNKTNKGGFLVLNKETGELTMFVPEDLDKPNITSRIKNIKQTIKRKTPPEFCYDPIPEGKSGNMKLPRGCMYCKHKVECHKDANDGQGLRVFNYAKGPVYFTNLVKVPNVEESL